MRACIVLLAALFYVNAANAKIFSFIYIEANEGDSSGGHVAVQFADQVFHYQYSDGLIRLFRQNADDFRFDYRFLQNRPLHVADIAVSDATYDLLYDRFKLNFFEQERLFRRLQAARQDVQLLAWLSRRAGAMPAAAGEVSDKFMRLPGAGLFYGDASIAVAGGERREACSAASRQVLAALRRDLEQQHGKDFLQRREAKLISAVRKLPDASESVAVSAEYGFSERYRDLMTGLLATQVMLQTRPLSAGSCRILQGPDGRLDAQQSQVLQGFRERLRHTAQTLAETKRPDWGYALFVAMARLIAVEQTLQSGYWTFLDDFAEDSAEIPLADFARYPEQMHLLRAEAAADWRELWSSLHGAIDERHYSRLEMAANRYREWQSSGNRHTLRYRGEQPLPVKAAGLADALLPGLSVRQFENALNSHKQYAEHLAQQLEEDYAYSLLTRNCVTEVLRNINAALGAETGQRLGGRIDPELNIVPFTAFAAVQSTYNVVNAAVLPSYRHQQLAHQYAESFAPLVYARESNTFSAQLYSRNPEDAWFVFFTDDALLLRPLFGAFNSAAGTAQSLFGLLLWPFDGGRQLAGGVRGLLMSLPELAFVNMRKGSYKYLSPQGAAAN